MGKCNHDCLNCIYDDCINGSTYSEKSLNRNRSEQARRNNIEFQKRRYQEAKKNGICTACKKKKATYGLRCYECYIKQKRYNRAQSSGIREFWQENGLCYQCGGEVVPGKKVCQRHYEILMKNIALCHENRNTRKAQKEFSRMGWIFQKGKG